jgi:hypothetical protein
MEFFTGRHNKILVSDYPSLVRAEFGALISIVEVANARGEAEVTITRMEGRSHVNFTFSFTKFYVASIIGIAAMGLIVFGAVYWTIGMVSYLPPQVAGNVLEMLNPLAILLIALYFILSTSIEAYSARRTRKKILAEFKMFTESLKT